MGFCNHNYIIDYYAWKSELSDKPGVHLLRTILTIYVVYVMHGKVNLINLSKLDFINKKKNTTGHQNYIIDFREIL
jgi:hypothetical protein